MRRNRDQSVSREDIMTGDELKNITTSALDRLALALDQGRSESLTSLLRTLGRFHTYSFHNVCLIVSQRPSATRVAGFQTWRQLGRFVRRGERGIAIMAPILRRGDVVDTADPDRSVVGFRAAYVFDVSQTDGDALPEPMRATGDPGPALVQLQQAVTSGGTVLEYVGNLDGALGTSSGGRIQLLADLAPAEEFAVLAHEYAHELLHHGDDRVASRDTRELEAEAVAFVVAHSAGLDYMAASRDYIHLYRGDREALTASLNRIQQTASTIIRAMSPP
jgi:hypothetical protein